MGGASRGDPNDPNNWGGGTVYLNGQVVDANNPWYYTPDEQDEVTLNAVADANYTFVMWLGDVPSGADPCDPQLVLPTYLDQQVWAGFGESHVLTASAYKKRLLAEDESDPNNWVLGGGEIYVNGEPIDSNNPWSHTFGSWAQVTLNAVHSPGMGGRFVWGYGVPDGQDPNDPQIVVPMDTDREVGAFFGCASSGMMPLVILPVVLTSMSLFLRRRHFRRRR
jgi:hypothetical protein